MNLENLVLCLSKKSLPQLNSISQSLFVKWFYFSLFWNNFSCTQLAFFSTSERFYILYAHIFSFSFSLLQKDLYIVHEHICAACFSLFQKDLDKFHDFFFPFFVDNIQPTIVYIGKIYIPAFCVFFI